MKSLFFRFWFILYFNYNIFPLSGSLHLFLVIMTCRIYKSTSFSLNSSNKWLLQIIMWPKTVVKVTSKGFSRICITLFSASMSYKQIMAKRKPYRRPMMGKVLQILHLAWCLAFSAAARRCMTGTQTNDCGSIRNQSRKCLTSISVSLLA